jgi:hypothetical protein
MYKNLATPGLSACVGACFISLVSFFASHRLMPVAGCGRGRAKAAP